MQGSTRHHPFWLAELAVATGAFAFLLAGDPRTALKDSEMLEVARAMPSLDQALTLWTDVRNSALACVTSPSPGGLRHGAASQAAAAASPALLLRHIAQGTGPTLCP